VGSQRKRKKAHPATNFAATTVASVTGEVSSVSIEPDFLSSDRSLIAMTDETSIMKIQ